LRVFEDQVNPVPSVILEDGVVKKESQFVVEAVSGMLYPAVKVNPKVPAVVIGEPEIESPVGTVIATDVTVPLIPKEEVAVSCQLVPSHIIRCP